MSRSICQKRPSPYRGRVPIAGIVGAALLGMLLLNSGAWSAEEEAQAQPQQFRQPVLIHFDGFISPMLEQYLYRKLEAAKQQGADLVIIEIDSPGGYLKTSEDVADRLRDLGWARTVAYIPTEALSGAAIVALGCDDIIMAPNATIGDAGPIYQNEFRQFEHAPEKIRTDLARTVRDLAKAKGRPPALAEAMVDKDLVVWKVKDTRTGKIGYMSEAEIESAGDPAKWEKLNPLHDSGKGKFLEVNGKTAVELTLATAEAADLEQLKKHYGIEGDIPEFQWTWVDTTILILNSWLVTGLLFVIGIIALYIEFSAPGIGIGGLTAVLCFALFFWSRFLGGTANWLEIVLFAAGLMFLAIELFVLPGFGISGLTGLLLLLVSVVMACQGFVIPESPQDWTQLTKNLLMVAGSGVICAFAVMYLSTRMGTLPVFKRLILNPPGASEQAKHGEGTAGEDGEAEDEVEIRVGDQGVAQSPLRPAGKARFGKRYVDVVTDGDFIVRNAPVEIMEIAGNRVVVREIE